MNYSLKTWNTFGINRYANNIVCAERVEQLLNVWQRATKNQQPVLILGEGSNVLFLDDFNGTVIINRIMGIEVTEDINSWYLHVGAGENWHQLVLFTLENNIPGLENLALIPGCAGASPVQNIGAYGIELKHVCQYVDCVDLRTGSFERLETGACRFGYRDSIFKHEYQDKFVITAIGLRLLKRWEPVLTYGYLATIDSETVTPEKIFDFVSYMRMTKLPDLKVNGNAGSFFKNPIIRLKAAQEMLARWPKTPHYPQADGFVKLAAGWLIDQCQLKGVSYGGASVHRQQALVLINEKNATSEDVVRLAHLVRQRVGEKFNIWLEPEVRFIGATGEVMPWRGSRERQYYPAHFNFYSFGQ